MKDAGPVRRSMAGREWALLLLLSFLWGGSFFFNGVAVRELPPLTIVAVRVGLAALILLAVMRAAGLAMPRDRQIWIGFFVMGLLNNAIPFSLIVWGQSHVASGVASILNATTPLFTVLVAHVFTSDEKLGPGRLVGLLVGFAGVVAMIGGDALGALGIAVAAQLACLGAALSYAFAGVFGRRFRRLGVSPMASATGQVMASSALLIPLVLIVDAPSALPLPSAGAIGALIGLASLSTALAYILYFRILAGAGATNLLLVAFLIPISASLLGIAFLDEALEAKHILGMALVGLGLAAIDGRPWRRLSDIRRRYIGAAPS